MFKDCASLVKLNLTYFNTKNVVNMGNMFSGCTSLVELNISNWDTHNLTNMEKMFYRDTSLINLDLSNLNLNNVNNKVGAFKFCSDELKNKVKSQNIKLKYEDDCF